MPDGDYDWQKQAHEDFGALSARVNSTEASINAIARRVDEIGRDNTTQFANVNRAMSDISERLTTKIDASNQATYNAQKPNWTAFFSTAAAVTLVALGLGTAVIAPINNDLNKLSEHLDKMGEVNITRHEYELQISALNAVMIEQQKVVRDGMKSLNDWMGSLRDRQRTDEDSSVSQRQVSELKDRFDERNKITATNDEIRFSRLENHIDTIDGNLVKRPEIEAMDKAKSDAMLTMNSTLNSRVDAVTARMNSMQAQLEAIFPPSKIVDQLWNSLSELRTRPPMPYYEAPPAPADKSK